MSSVLDDKVVRIIKGVAEFPEEFEVTGEQSLRDDLGIDSLGMIDLVMRVEDELAIKINESSVSHFATVVDLQRYIREMSANPVS